MVGEAGSLRAVMEFECDTKQLRRERAAELVSRENGRKDQMKPVVHL